MAKTNPFEFDVSKMMGADVSKMMGAFKVPHLDLDALLVAQRKNIEALTAANQCALEGIGALVQRQSEIARSTVESYSAALRELMGVGSAEEKAARQAEFVKTAYETTIQNLRELGELALKTRDEAFGALNKRVTESLDEVKSMVANGSAGKSHKK